MKGLADKIHGMGLKFGLYSSAGTMTCQRKAGGLGYETQDA
jgi:alpha-galactosidase